MKEKEQTQTVPPPSKTNEQPPPQLVAIITVANYWFLSEHVP